MAGEGRSLRWIKFGGRVHTLLDEALEYSPPAALLAIVTLAVWNLITQTFSASAGSSTGALAPPLPLYPKADTLYLRECCSAFSENRIEYVR